MEDPLQNITVNHIHETEDLVIRKRILENAKMMVRSREHMTEMTGKIW